MDISDWFTRFVLTKFRSDVFEFAPNAYQTSNLELDAVEPKDGFQSDILEGHIVYTDKSGNQIASKAVILKIFPQDLRKFLRNSFIEITFQNEIFVYNRILPFFATLDESISNLFPEFYRAHFDCNDEKEEGVIFMENLTVKGFRSTTSKVFLDIEHLQLMMKKLGEFHAYSYKAKKENPRKFYSLVDCLKETNGAVTRIIPNQLHPLNEYIFEIMSRDTRYTTKVKQIREIIGDTEEFISRIFDTKEEPMSVICHGDFLRNNVLFKYDLENNPIDVKFIDLGNVRYCSPVLDLGAVLYMNVDQPTRDEYWDLLIQTYYDSLAGTFPGSEFVPEKQTILDEFKVNVLNNYLLIASFIPLMMASEEEVNPDWLQESFEPEYVEYKHVPFMLIPGDVRVNVILKAFKPHRVEKVLEILRDVIDRGFV